MDMIVLHPKQLIDMQYLGPHVRLLLTAPVSGVVPGDLVVTPGYGCWLVKAVEPVASPSVVHLIADLIEDTELTGSNHGYAPDMDAWPPS